MMITVRPARAEERATLLSIWRGAVEATHHFLTKEDVDWYEPFVASYLQEARDLRVAVRVEGSAQGATDEVIVGFVAQEEGAIQMLFVHERAHRSGVGSALLASVREDFVQAGGQGGLKVDVNEDNESGRRFYEARGFQVDSRSATDDQGRPFPILHLRLTNAATW